MPPLRNQIHGLCGLRRSRMQRMHGRLLPERRSLRKLFRYPRLPVLHRRIDLYLLQQRRQLPAERTYLRMRGWIRLEHRQQLRHLLEYAAWLLALYKPVGLYILRYQQ